MKGVTELPDVTLAYKDNQKIESHGMLLSLGGRLASAEYEATKPPDNITMMLLEYGEHGIIIDGIISWITMNRDMTAENIRKQLMEK